MTKATGYTTFNVPNRSWTVRDLARRITSNLFFDCCGASCYPKCRNRVEEESSNEKILQNEDLERKKDQMEMKRMASDDSLTKNEIPANVDGSRALIQESNYRPRGLEKSALTINFISSEGTTYTPSSPSFGIKRSLTMLSKTNKKNDSDERKEFESDSESSFPDIFSKHTIRKSDERRNLSSYSELFPKCQIRKSGQQKSCDNNSEDGISQFYRVIIF